MSSRRATWLGQEGQDPALWALSRYARVWSVLAVGLTTIIGTALIFVSPIVGLSGKWTDGTQAVGESVIASIILYVLVTALLDPPRHAAQAREIVNYTAKEANRYFEDIFKASLPSSVFPSSKDLKRDFRDSFVSSMLASRRYHVLGVDADFTAFRLAMCKKNEHLQNLDIRITIVDPRSDAVRAYADIALKEGLESQNEPVPPDVENNDRLETQIATKMSEIQRKIFVSLVALYDASGTVPIDVYLSDHLPFLRCEMFDESMYLTYYVGSSSFPQIMQFARDTRSFHAYESAMGLARKFSRKFVRFGLIEPSKDAINDERQLDELLNELDCTFGIEELRAMRNRRFAELKDKLKRAGISQTELF